MRYKSSSAVLVVLAIAQFGCDTTSALNDLSSLLNRMVDDKSMLEQFVRDIKKAPVRGVDSPDYLVAQRSYAEVQAAQAAYLGAVRVAALSGAKSANLDSLVTPAKEKSSQFISAALKALGQQRALPPDGVVTFTKDLHRQICRVPLHYRAEALDELERQTRLASWDAL
jgi:hypothetical protein